MTFSPAGAEKLASWLGKPCPTDTIVQSGPDLGVTVAVACGVRGGISDHLLVVPDNREGVLPNRVVCCSRPVYT